MLILRQLQLNILFGGYVKRGGEEIEFLYCMMLVAYCMMLVAYCILEIWSCHCLIKGRGL